MHASTILHFNAIFTRYKSDLDSMHFNDSLKTLAPINTANTRFTDTASI